jgi:hypothetical protein
MVDVARDGADHFACAPLHKLLQDADLAQAQMRVHHSQREHEIAIGFGLDERHLKPVPANGHRLFERHAFAGKRVEPLGHRPGHRPECGAARQGHDSDKQRDPERHQAAPSGKR